MRGPLHPLPPSALRDPLPLPDQLDQARSMLDPQAPAAR
jgi:hypothetical protein